MNTTTFTSHNGEDISPVSTNEIEELTHVTEDIPKTYTDSAAAIKGELAIVTHAIDTWERLAPQLYQIKRRLTVIDEFLSGKRDIEGLTALAQEAKIERKRRGPPKGTKREFIRRKSDILTDAVIAKIRDFIAADEQYHKSKEIYHFLIENNLIQPFTGDVPERTFAIALSRVDQDEIVYNKKPTVMAWGLPDFGTPEHARRRALKNSVRGKEGTKVTSYGRGEPVPGM